MARPAADLPLLRPAQSVPVILGALLGAVTVGAVAGTYTDGFGRLLLVAAVVLVGATSTLASLATLLFITVLVPYQVQNDYAISGGAGVPGLLLADLLLVVSLARVTVGYLRQPMEGSALVAYLLLLLAALQLAHGILAGVSPSEAGAEARRVAMAIGGFLLAINVLRESSGRQRLPPLLLAVALALGAWGLGQWFLGVEYNGGDAGVREGVSLTSGGRGQLQGGLYAFPVAIILLVAALAWDRAPHGWPRVLVIMALTANVVSLLLTFERTFWGATAIGCAFVFVRSTRAARRRMLIWGPPCLTGMLLVFVIAAPGELLTAVERGASVSQAGTDSSVEYRIVESREVLELIAARPIEGSGFGAALNWTTPGAQRALTTSFVHNGYLWLAWKVGVPLALVALVILVASLRRQRVSWGSDYAFLHVGAQAAVLSLLVINVTFPSLNTLGVSVLTGLLVALALMARSTVQSSDVVRPAPTTS